MKQEYKSKFGHKSANGTINWKKDQNDRDRFTKAKMLRNYSRLCAKEGIISDRVNMGPKKSNDGNFENKKKFQEKTARPSPFAKAELQASAAKEARLATKNLKVTREQAIKDAEHRRKETTKVYSARTKKGQPMLSKMSSLLLSKITSRLNKP